MAKQPISDAAQIFGARVRARRNELGKSQEGLADDSGMHWTFIGQVERGQRNVSLHNILKLAEALGVDAAELVRGLKSPDRADSDKNRGLHEEQSRLD
ncbi:helix-turn-helix transcriptional regulator [Streptomyces sp. NPDC048277]|uniref:helix-turn-helix domain-containing protein n=1 Tax=Streptomyces sp. NPDC048277 TaxID=3155027 RepID=UPI003403182E